MSEVIEQLEAQGNSYNEVPYPGSAFRATHPSHLAMVASLLGMKPANPARCRVLELGCSMGANLIPMAESLPESQFLGIDFAQRQIDAGQRVLGKLDLKNVELKCQSILDFNGEGETFDYIICHGVYSWVSREVQEAILKVGTECLSENGVMYVSYNTYPGWHLRGVVRDMMQYHVEDISNAQEKVAQAKGLLDFLVKYANAKSEAYSTLLKEEAELLANSVDSYIFHEHLEEVNEPLYFNEFVRRTDASGLRYLADSALPTMLAQKFDQEAAQILHDAPILRREQYMDFLRNRMFRGSLICRPEIRPDYRLKSSNVMHLSAALKRPLTSKQSGTGETQWSSADGALTTKGCISELVQSVNDAFPSWVSVSKLVEGIPDEKDRLEACDALLMGFIHGLFALSESPVEIAATVTEKPGCTALARLQASYGPKITNLLHNDLVVQPQQRFLLSHLDGSRTAEELAELLFEECEKGRFKISREGEGGSLERGEVFEICKAELVRLRYLALLSQ